jgi:hypothetical protein
MSEKIIEKIKKIIEDNNEELFIEILNNQIEGLEELVLTKKKQIEERNLRKQELEQLKKEFIEEYLESSEYYYIPDTDLFLVYKSKEETINYDLENEEDSDSDSENENNELYGYELINENKIWSKISKKINKEGILTQWKQKVRLELISKMKKKKLLINAIPDSSTIQRVLSIFTSTITTHKELSKYLLTIIGDSIFRKQTEDIYFVNNDLYKALNVLQYNINKYIKCLFLTNFKTKYHNQSYENIRYIKSNTNIDKSYLWEQLFKKHIFDIIAVAGHYSNRFNNSETFLNEHCISITEIEQILYVKTRTKEEIIEEFEKCYLEGNNVLNMKIKEVYYLWKEYLNEKNLPNTIYLQDLTNYLDIKYENIDSVYQKLTSPKLNYIKNILDFVNNEIIIIKEKEDLEENDNESETIFTGKYNLMKYVEPNNYELGELYQIFQYWRSVNNINVNVNENILLNVLKHFCENILIEDNKYFYGIKCELWNKEEDVKEYIIENEKSIIKYNKYCKWCKEKNKRFIVSKSYFDYIKKSI